MSPSFNFVRGRTIPRNPIYTQPSLLPTNRPFRITPSRPRTFLHNPLEQDPTTPTYLDSKKPRPSLVRLPSSGLVVSTIALAFFVFGIIVSSNISTILVSPRARDLPLSIAPDPRKLPSTFAAFYPISNVTSFSNLTQSLHNSNFQQSLPPSTHSTLGYKSPLRNQSKALDSHNHLLSQSSSLKPQNSVKPVPYDPMRGRVSWNRSWPASPQLDDTHLFHIASALNFTNRTMLNYFHMHKTGGVTLKSEVMAVVNNPENKAKFARRGRRLSYIETCYEVAEKNKDMVLESTWRCDFGNVRKMSHAQLAVVDIVMGHQYWNEGTEIFFSTFRDVRHFSIFRHPLPRKLSFFYHFFVRNVGRDEAKVGKDEIISFLLGQEMPQDESTRDAGPNYYASRMLSDGISGFVGNRFELTKRQSDDAISNASAKLEKKYAFVGLQLQNEASQCMLEKLIQVFAHGHGIDDLVGTPKLSFNTAKLNSGGYPWTSTKLWKAMTTEQRKRYKEVERVDLAIYERAVRKFEDDVKLFSCEEKVNEDAFLQDVFE